MSPEQARGQDLDQRTDVFSLGVVLYEMTAGRIPFAGATSMDTLVSILEKEPPPLDLARPEVPAEFQRIVSKTLRKDREDRYQTIKDLLIDLKSFKDELFVQKLERAKSRPPSKPSAQAAATDQNVVAATAADHSSQRKANPVRRAVTVGLALIVLSGLVIGGLVLWRRSASRSATIAPAAAVQREVSYWITVQKYRDGKPYQEPFRLSDDINFEKDYRIRLNVTSAQSGRLYLLNEGTAAVEPTPTFNVMFPSETANNGSALLKENQQIQIPEQSWFQFDEQQGTEKIWVVWSKKDVPELEAVKSFANSKDRGVISSPGLRTAVAQFLKAHSSSMPSVERDQEKKETIVRSNSEILVHVIKLEHH
jgi:serine/threonine protein kinase